MGSPVYKNIFHLNMGVQSIQFLQTGRQLPPRYNLTIQNYVDILISFNNLLDFDQRKKNF